MPLNSFVFFFTPPIERNSNPQIIKPFCTFLSNNYKSEYLDTWYSEHVHKSQCWCHLTDFTHAELQYVSQTSSSLQFTTFSIAHYHSRGSGLGNNFVLWDKDIILHFASMYPIDPAPLRCAFLHILTFIQISPKESMSLRGEVSFVLSAPSTSNR